jgi:hypothetical protein
MSKHDLENYKFRPTYSTNSINLAFVKNYKFISSKTKKKKKTITQDWLKNHKTPIRRYVKALSIYRNPSPLRIILK